jgi:monofunctional glycosyltransferase
VPAAKISDAVFIAMVAAEDQKFPQHHGFDLQAIEQALDERERGTRRRGASTISQQVAKNLFLWQEQSWVRKGVEAWFTVLIETLWPKRRILEVYANVAELGDRTYGVEAAAQRYFRKPAVQLTRYEAALLAAALPAPRRYRVSPASPYVATRARWIDRQVGQLGGPTYLDGPEAAAPKR